MKPNATEILDKIINQDTGFSINGDAKLTAAVRADMRVDRNPVLSDIVATPVAETVISSNNEQPTIEDLIPIPEFDRNNLWYQTYITTMQEYHIISDKLPRHTRFYRIKCIINKLIRVSTRYQEIFNNSVCNLSSQIVGKIESIQKSIQDICNNINFRLTHMQRKLEQQEAEAVLLQSSTDAKIAELYELVYQLRSESTKDVELEKWLRAEAEHVAGLEKWLRAEAEHVAGLEKWLHAEGARIEGIEKWLDVTNRRVDSCNELISASPDITYQSFSQAGEDLIVSFILANMPNPPKGISYLDIGCNHYKNLNNTFRFYQKGYCGVLVEANPKLIDELRQYRPRDITVNCGVGAESGKSMDFYVINGDGLSSFNREFIDATLAQTLDAQIESTIPIEVISINEIIERYFKECPTFVSIDIEGNELSSLSTMDFEKYRPLIFIIETIEYRKYVSLGIKRQDIVDFMLSKDYEEYAFTGINSIFVDTRILKKDIDREIV